MSLMINIVMTVEWETDAVLQAKSTANVTQIP